MKAGLSIQELVAELQRRDQAKLDYLADTQHLLMETWGDQPMLRLSDENGTDLIEPLELLPTAHRQLGDYLKIPRKYYERMLREDPDLLAINVNRWLHREYEPRMLRTMNGQVRAFLSNRYRCIDHLDIARVVLPILGEMPQIEYVSTELTDDFMYIKVVDPRLTAEVVPGDVVQAGLVISNSETGQGSICVQPLIYRLVCTNGMAAGDPTDDGIRRIHKGRVYQIDEAFQILPQESLREETDGDFIGALQNTVRTTVNEDKLLRIVENMRVSKQLRLNIDNLPGLIKLAGTLFKFTEDEGDGVMRHWLADSDFTVYGLANAVTRYSQDVSSYDRASKLEGIGYKVMTMSPDMYRRLNQTAEMAA